MRSAGLALLFIAQVNLSFSQTINPWSPEAGKFLELQGDKIAIYFDATGNVSDECAMFVRHGMIHPSIINVEGPFVDYDRSGKVVFRGIMHDNELNGVATYYYDDGSVKATGTYRANKRDSTWTSYHSNGVVDHTYIYQNGEPLVWEASGKNGKRNVSKGTGEYKVELQLQTMRDYNYFGRGAIKDGKKHGEWVIIDPGSQEKKVRETYNEGQLVSGKVKWNDQEYTTHPKISFVETSIHEQVGLIESLQLCSVRYGRVARYKNAPLHEGFFAEVMYHLNENFEQFNSQWLSIAFAINEWDRIQDISVVSSINDERIELFLIEYLKSTVQWEAARANKQKTSAFKFFTVLLNEKGAVVPAQLLYDNAEQKVFYNNANEITVQELSTHYRTAAFSSKSGFLGEVSEYDNSGNKYMELHYDRNGKKEGKFWYDKNGLKLEGIFINNRANLQIPDSILTAIQTKEKFKKAKYIRKREHGRIKIFIEPDINLSRYFRVADIEPVIDPDVMPDFPGGKEPLFQFIAFHFSTPQTATEKNLKGVINLEFTVLPDGSLVNFQVIKGLGHGCDEAAVEALRMVPDWLPGKKDGLPVPVRINLDIPFPIH